MVSSRPFWPVFTGDSPPSDRSSAATRYAAGEVGGTYRMRKSVFPSAEKASGSKFPVR
jgi:hypothetical protein